MGSILLHESSGIVRPAVDAFAVARARGLEVIRARRAEVERLRDLVESRSRMLSARLEEARARSHVDR
jgi:hypothetical protein